MKKIIFLVFLISLLIFLPFVSSLNLDVKKVSEGEIMVAGVNRPAVFQFEIKNLGSDTGIEFYNLLGFRMLPSGFTEIKAFETKSISLEVSPIGEFEHIGSYTFTYYIRDTTDAEIESKLTFKRIYLEDAFEIGATNFNPESSSLEVFVKNKENFNFGEITAKFSSLFFDVEKTFSLEPKETETVAIELNREDFKKLLAGFYTLNVEITAGSEKANLESSIEFIEKDIVKTDEASYGFIVNTKIIKKTNEGNVVTPAQVTIKKNIVSRLFTTFSSEPDVVDRKGFSVSYVWNRSLKPGETFEVSVKTNWTFPFLIILLVVIVVVLAKQTQKTNLSLKKTVSFVKAKGGAFALKVTVYAHARKFVEKVNVIDRLPPLVNIYERFGSEKPVRIDEKNKKIEWHFSQLQPGESRIMTYIIYSKVGVFGKFALPSARAVYEKDGTIHDAESNKAFFVTEQRGSEQEWE